MRLFVITRDERVTRLDRRADGWDVMPVLDRAAAQCVATRGDRVLVGTRESGAVLSEDAGRTWASIELPEPFVLSVAIGAADGALYAGTEPSRLFVSRDGTAWSELEALQDIPSKPRWSFPPRPWTHHVRWIAPDPHDADRVLVGIELGGLMLTTDGGATFSDHRDGARRDVHSLAWHPSAPGRAYEAAGDGAACSDDGGETWRPLDAGRDLRYCWAVAADAADADRWYVSAASGPRAAHAGEGARGKLYRWEADAWRQLPLPGDSMPYALAASDGALIAATTDGHLLHSHDRGESWDDGGVRLGSVLAMAAVDG